MELDELASQFGGKRVTTDSSDDLASQFGGKKVIQAAPEDDLAAQFGGKRIAPAPESPIPVEGAPEGPTVFQRVKDIAAAPIEAIMGKDAFKESAPSPSPLKGSVKKGFLNVEQSVIQNQLASLMDLQAADKEKYGETYQAAPADKLDKISARDKTIQDKLRSVADLGLQRKAIENKEGVFELSKSLKDLYSTKEYKDSSFLDGLGMIGNKIAENPSGIPGWIAGVGVESLPQSMVTVAAALAARMGGMGPKGAAIVGGGGSSFMEFGSQYADLRAQGLSHEQAWEEAGVKSAIIGLFDAASFNAAGKSAGTVFKNIEKGALKETVKDVSKGVGIQALYGGAGEGLGSFAINQKVDPGAVLEEMVGEVFGAPVEAVSTYQNKKAEAIAGQAPPTAPPIPPTQEPVTKDYLNAVTRYEGMGLSRADAGRLAEEELKEAGYEPELITRARESSISTPNVQADVSGTTQGTTGTESVGLGGTSGTPGNVGVGAENERSALIESLKTKYNLTDEQAVKASDESLRQKQIVKDMEEPTPPSSGTITPGLQSLDSPESQQVQDSTGTMAHTLFNPNNVRTDGRPGWDSPPKERWPLINAFEMGGRDARSGYSKGAKDYKNKQERQAYELGLKYATGLMAGLPADVTPSITPDATPKVTKGKSTGRPKSVLTPEERVAKTEARKGSQGATRDAIRLAEKSQKVMDETFDPGEYEFEAAQVAQEEFTSRRRQALEDAHVLSTSPAHRNNKAGTIAKAILAKATPQERELAKNRAETRQKLNAPSRAEITESTNGEDNPKFETFNQARAALTWITKNGNEFERALAKRLAPYLNGVKLVVVDSHLDLPSKSLQNSMDGAVGLYVAGRNTIYLLRDGGINNTVFLHEALHGATVKRINSYLQAKLEGRPIPNNLRVAVAELYETMDEAKQLYDTLKAQGMLDNGMLAIPYNAFTDIKEFVAYGLTTPAMQEFLALAPGFYAGEKQNVISRIFTRFVQSLRTMFNMDEKHESALQDLIIITDKLLRIKEQEVTPTEETNAAKKAKAATKKVDKTEEKLRLSKDSTTSTGFVGEMIRDGHTFEDYKDLFNASFSSLDNKAIKAMLFNLQTVDILRWKGDEIPGLKESDKLQQEMSAMRTHMLAASAKKADKLGSFIRKNGMQTLADAMHTARLEKVSPTKAPNAATYIIQDPIVKHYSALIADPNATKEQKAAYTGQRTKRINSINKVYEKWDALGKQKGGHEMYEMVRQFYIDNYTATRTILNDQIEALKIDDAAKAKLLKSVRLMQEETKGGKDDDYDGIDIKALPEEYFPFGRSGKYWLRVAKGPTGREFYLFESGGERNRFLLKRAKELGLSKDDPNFSAGDDITSLRKDFQDSSIMLQEMFAAIDETAVNPKFDASKYATAAEANAAFKEELKDQLYQTYLMTMPERSFRKQFLHSENVTGFTSDIFRNFKNSATSYANQLSKLKYANDITGEIQRARDSLEGMPAMERAKMELFVNELSQRAQEEINPPEPGQIATRINQFAFIMLLTSAASAATQMASVPIMVMPSLNAEYGYGASAKAFAKYSQIWKSMGITQEQANGDVEFTAPSMGSSKMVKGDPILQRAFQAAVDREITTLTNTSVLTNRNRTPDSSFKSLPGTALRVGFNGITAMFSGSERMSRELTYMMAFELEYAKSKDFQKSVDKAVDTTHELLGRYDNFNRPRVLRNALGKTVGQFKMYAVFMTSFFLRNGYQIIRLSTPVAERVEAMHRLAGILVMGGMFHGLVGMPGYSVICAVIDAFFSGGDEEEKKARRAKNPLTAEDSNLRFRYDFLPSQFGNNTVTGLDGRQHRLSDMLEKGPISALTDINIGSRTSFDGMWFRDAKPGKTYLESAQNLILANMGPGVSTGVNMVGAVDDFSNGRIIRGLEKLVPAFFRGSLTAYRLDKEGAETKGGADMLKREEINTLNLIATTLGFQSSRLARIQEHNFQMQKQITEAQNKRASILKRLDEVVFDAEKGPTELKTVFNQIREHNKRYPMEKFLIEADTIDSSLKTYAKKRGLTYRGQYMDEKLIPYLLPSAKRAAPIPEKE